MLDIKYYIKSALPKQEDQDAILKFFGKIKFNSLLDSISFFKNIDKKVGFISNKKEKEKILGLAPSVVQGLEAQRISPLDFLNAQVFPQIDMMEAIADLRPKKSGNSIICECASCRDAKKKHPTKDNRDAFVVSSGGMQTGTIKCSRGSCGETTSILRHIMDRDNTNFRETVINLAKSVGIDYESYERNSELHIEDNGSFKKNNIEIERKALKVELEKRHYRNEFGLMDIEFKKADLSKDFRFNLTTSSLLGRYGELDKKYRVQMIYDYIKMFTTRERDRGEMVEYFAGRGLSEEATRDVGVLKASKVNKLVSELKDIFGEKDLIEFGVISEKFKSWRYMLLTKDDKYTMCDSAVFFMHDIYSNIPTNIEFKFYGDKVEGSPRKAVSMAQSDIVPSNYYGSGNNIDFIKNENSKTLWWTEAVIDAKTVEQLGMKANSLIGVQKHFNENIGYYKDKISIIAFDEDVAGIKNSEIFAKKLRLAGAKHIFFASWDTQYGKDLNDLLQSRNLDKIQISFAVFSKGENGEITISSDIGKLQYLQETNIAMAYSKSPKKDEVVITDDKLIVNECDSVNPSIKDFQDIMENVKTKQEINRKESSEKPSNCQSQHSQISENQEQEDIIINNL
jgi:hypothetical protein